MKCCKCGKEIDIEVSVIPPRWFGKYTGSELKEVICSDCLKNIPEGKSWTEK